MKSGMYLSGAWLVVVMMIVTGTEAMASPVKVGVIGAMEESVSVQSQDGTTRDLKQGDAIYLNEQIVTGETGKAQIMFLDKSSLMVNPSSEVMIDTFVYNPGATTGDLTIRNAKGALRFIGGVLSKEKPVLIKTPVSTIGIRGGMVDTHVADNGATDAIFLFGKELTVENQNGEVFSVTEVGKGITVATPNSAPVLMPPAKVRKRLNSFPKAGKADAKNESKNKKDGPAKDKRGSKEANNETTSGEPKEEGDRDDGIYAETDSETDYNDADDNYTSEETSENRTETKDGTRETRALRDADGSDNTGAITNSTLSTFSTANQDETRDKGDTTLANNTPTPTLFGRYALRQGTISTPISAGDASFSRSGDRFIGKFDENFPLHIDGKYVSNLPAELSAGYNAYDSSENYYFTGLSVRGESYVSPSQSMIFYRLTQSDGNRVASTVFGRRLATGSYSTSAAATTADSANGLSFYDFLPSMVPTNSVNGGLGFFDYNTANSIFSTDAHRLAHPGLAVDYSSGKYLSGILLWNNGATTNALSFRRDLILTFGDVDTTGSGPLLEGTVYEYNRTKASTVGGFEDRALDLGYFRTDEQNVYSESDGSVIEGMIIEAAMPDNQGTEYSNPYSTSIASQKEVQALVLGDGNSAAQAAATSVTDSTFKGYTAGFVTKDINQVQTARTTDSYWNTVASGVSLDKDQGSHSVGATMKIFQVSDNSQAFDAFFGTQSGVGDVDSAFLADDLYAAQMGKVTYDPAGSPDTITGIGAERGVIVGAELISEGANICTDCSYVEWGVWAADIDRTVGANTVTDVVNLMPYVAGDVTQNLQTNVSGLSLGTVTYSGVMYGTTLTTSDVQQRHTGSFTSAINLDTRTMNNYIASIAGMQFGTSTAVNLPSSGDAIFTNVSVQNTGSGSPGDIAGTINGALFGPQAQDMGGNFNVTQSTTGTEATGVYIGTRN